MAKLSLYAGALSVYDHLRGNHSVEYDAKADKLTLTFRVNKGQSPVELTEAQIPAAVEALESFNPDEPRTIPEIIRRSLSIEKDDDGTEFYVFKVSDAHKARSNRIPVEHFAAMVDLVNGYDPSAERSPAELISDTISVDDSGELSFKVSNAANYRATKLPQEDLGDLVRFLKEAPSALNKLRAQLRLVSPATTDANKGGEE